MSRRTCSHWGLVLNRRVLATLIPAVLRWIENAAARERRTERAGG